MTSEGTTLPPGAELRVRISADVLGRLVSTMLVAAKERPAALGPQMLQVRAAIEGERTFLVVGVDTGEMRLQMEIDDVEVMAEGAISVVLQEFAAKAKSISAGDVEISVLTETKIVMRAARTLWEISGTVGFDVAAADTDLVHLGTMEAAELSRAVRGVAPAVPRNAGRPVLERVHLQKGWAIATSGALLLKRKVGELSQPVDIPRSVVSLVGGLKDGDVHVSKGKKRTQLRYSRISISFVNPLLPYPDVSKAEMAAHVEDHEVLVTDVDAFLDSLKRVRSYAAPDQPVVTVRTIPTAKSMAAVLSSEDRSGNLAREALEAHWQSEKRLVANFHYQHLVSLLKGLTGQIELRISVEGKSIMVEDDGVLGIAQQILA